MNIKIQDLQDKLCKSLCAEIHLVPKKNDLVLIENPFYFPDGDPYQIYLKELTGGILRLTDMGHTMMQLSYENDIEKFRKGTRGDLLEQILAELDIKDDEGKFYIDGSPDELSENIFKLSQALTKINDLTFLNKARAEATFYEDLNEELYRHIDESKIQTDYIYENIENAADYKIDYCIDGITDPLFVFGIPGKDKTRLTTIILERLLRAQAKFESILIFADQKAIPRGDLSRLSNAGGEMIASLDAKDDLKRKLLKRVANGEQNA